MTSRPRHWHWFQRVLHWAMAGLVIFMLGAGIYMSRFLDEADPEALLAKFSMIQTHKSWGAVLLMVWVVRICWRSIKAGPGVPNRPARVVHAAFYVLLAALPISGWLMASASPLQDTWGLKNMVFGLVEMPDPFVPGDQALADGLKTLHTALAILLTVLVIGHVAAAFWHEYVRRDGIMRKMIGVSRHE